MAEELSDDEYVSRWESLDEADQVRFVNLLMLSAVKDLRVGKDTDTRITLLRLERQGMIRTSFSLTELGEEKFREHEDWLRRQTHLAWLIPGKSPALA